MDLSALIFAILAVGWAVYLIPKALQRNEELAKSRSVDTFSDRIRVLGGGGTASTKPAAAPSGPVAADPALSPTLRSTVGLGITREAARRAAQRRRRVLMVLLMALATVAALSGFAIAPLWAPAIPAGLILAFLITARISLRRQQRAVRSVAAGSESESKMETKTDTEVADFEEDTVGTDVGEFREPSAPVSLESPVPASAEVIADGGSLWDPLPVTLPTYVTKPTARRTVRSIELTTGVTSSGHDAADSKLARDAKAAEQAVRDAEAAASETSPEQKREAAGA